MKIEMTGYAAMRADVRTVDDIRRLVKTLDENKVRGDANVDWGSGHVYVGVAEDAKVTWIECGDHLAGDEQWDLLIETHEHDEGEPAAYDWPTKDKRKRTGAYHPTAEAYCYDNGHSIEAPETACYVCGKDFA